VSNSRSKRRKSAEAASPRQNRSADTTRNKYTLVAVVLVTFALAVGITTGRKLQPAPGSSESTAAHSHAESDVPGYISDPANHQTHDPLWPQIKEVAQHFLCGCGDCGDMHLVECTCDMPNGGIQEKGFIRQQLLAGQSVDQVIAMVDEKFGRRIPAETDAGVSNPTS